MVTICHTICKLMSPHVIGHQNQTTDRMCRAYNGRNPMNLDILELVKSCFKENTVKNIAQQSTHTTTYEESSAGVRWCVSK